MKRDEPPHDRQTESRAALLRRVEGLEQPFGFGIAEAGVSVREARGVYSVSARFQVPESPALALAVLTDYEHIARFMPGVETSIVLERAGDRALVQQEAVSRLMLFSRRVHLVLEITEGADTLRFRDRSGRSFMRYEGTWRLCEAHGGTEILYELTAEPSFDVPEFLLKRLLRRDSGQMIEALRTEIMARSTRRSSVVPLPDSRDR